MNNLARLKQTAKHLFHDVAMFVDVATTVNPFACVTIWGKHADVARLVDEPATLPLPATDAFMQTALRRAETLAVQLGALARSIRPTPKYQVATFAEALADDEGLQYALASSARRGFAGFVLNSHFTGCTASGSSQVTDLPAASTRSITHT